MEVSTPDFKTLLQLQEIETIINTKKGDIKKIDETINQIDTKIKELSERFLKLKEEMQHLHVEKNKLENDLITTEETIKKLQIELNQTKKVEQYNLISAEIEKLKKMKDETEDKIIAKIDEIENKKAEIDNFSKELEKEKTALNETIAKLENEKRGILNYISEMEKQKNEVRSQISDQKILSRFDMLINTKEGVAIVKAEMIKREDNNQMMYICSGCRMKLNANDISSLKKFNTFAVCQNCSRLVYLDEGVLS